MNAERISCLPEFPDLNWGDVDGWRIETAVERLINRADRIYMEGRCTESEYLEWHHKLGLWADRHYNKTIL